MTDNKTFKSKIMQSSLKWLAIIVLLTAFACALWVNFGLRAPVEARSKTVGLLVDYDELKRIADGSNNIEFPDMLRKAALAGATGLVVRERILSDWEIAGDILVYTGGQLKFLLETQLGESADDAVAKMSIIPGKTYILTKDPLVYEQIFSLLEAKRRYPEVFEYPGYKGIAVNLHSAERANLGLGFPYSQLDQAAAAGFQIIPRLRSWEPVTGDNINEVMRWVSAIPNLAGIGFNDQSLPGDISNPILLDRYRDAIAPLGKPLISFEFYDQTGLTALSARLDDHLLRAHAIAENEVQKYADFDDAMARYSLAAKERNIRYIYIRFQGLIDPAASMLRNMELIEKVHDGLIDDGLQVGNPEPIPNFTVPQPLIYLLGAGVIVAGGWLIALFAGPFLTKKKWIIPFCILMALGLAAWGVGLVVLPLFARRLFALAAAIFFPSLSIVLLLKHDNGTGHLSQDNGTGHLSHADVKDNGTGHLSHADVKEIPSPRFKRLKRLLRAIAQLVLISLFTLMGAMIMSALLAKSSFMLKVDGFFTGVKVSHIVPLGVVPFLLWLKEKDWYGSLSGTVKGNVKFWQLGVCFVLLAAVVLYILRTGNESQDAVSGLERQARQMLDNWLGVRPRTTEFLIGHPLMLVMLYYGYRYEMFPLLMLGLMGQISLINTYAHMHTPLLVSLQRSGHGLWSGILIGIIVIVILELILSRLRVVNARRAQAISE